MSDLDDLAAAAHTPNRPALPPRARPASRGPILMLSIIVIVLSGIIVGMALSDRNTPIVERGLLGSGNKDRDSGGFTVTAESTTFEKSAQSLKLANFLQYPLEITEVKINGEFSAVLVKEGTDRAMDRAVPPARLTIGESAFFVYSKWYDISDGYKKQIVYIEITTNRGKFHKDGVSFGAMKRID